MNNTEVRLVYTDGNLYNEVIKAAHDAGAEGKFIIEPENNRYYWSREEEAWLFQEGKDIVVRFADGKHQELCRIKGKKMIQYVPRMALKASIYAPAAYSKEFRLTYGFEEDVKEFRQKLIKELLTL